MSEQKEATMEFEDDNELLDRLQAHDPAASLSPLDHTRVAQLLEDTMSTGLSRETGTEPTGARRNPITWLVAAAAAVALLATGGFWLNSLGSSDPLPPRADAPTVTELTAPDGTASGKCMVPSAATLKQQTLAFEGTVTNLTEDRATLRVSRWYAGEPTDLVEVQAPSEDMQALIGAVAFEEGGTYLVAATGQDLAVCGFSGPNTPELAALYAEAFGG
jgi:hypothetical protein